MNVYNTLALNTIYSGQFDYIKNYKNTVGTKTASHGSSFRKVVVVGKTLQHSNQSIVNEFVLILLTI